MERENSYEELGDRKFQEGFRLSKSTNGSIEITQEQSYFSYGSAAYITILCNCYFLYFKRECSNTGISFSMSLAEQREVIYGS